MVRTEAELSHQEQVLEEVVNSSPVSQDSCCQFCGEKFPELSSLLGHLRVHLTGALTQDLGPTPR